MAVGFTLVLFGVWLLLRTVVHDDFGHNLVDVVLGLGGSIGGPSSAKGKKGGGGLIPDLGIPDLPNIPNFPDPADPINRLKHLFGQ
jgi:hypothetical protein